ncbi:23959_t:CDS:1, partial [Racocetra persica]
DEVADIVVDLSSHNNLEASKVAQAMEKYVQIVDKSVATEGMLNKQEIICIVQAKKMNKNKKV